MKNMNSGVTYTNRESQSFNFYLNDLRKRERSLHVVPEYINKHREAFEREQIQCILNGGTEAEMAKKRLFTANERFVVSIVNATLVDGIEQMDLINVGCAALWRCIDTLKEEPKVSFATYARKLITGDVSDAIVELKSIIKKPRCKSAVLKEYRRLTENIQDPDFDFEHYIDVMCENEEVFEMARKNITVLSLDEPLEEGYSRCETIAAEAETDVFEERDTASRIIEIVHRVANLFESNVFLALYGLNGQFYTQEMICRDFNINMKQLLYIEQKVLKQLRYSIYAKELKELLA